MRKKLFNNWGLKLASLVLAVVVWFLVVQIEDPTDTKTFNNITVKITGTEFFEKTNQVYKVLDKTDKVNVTVRAPKSIIGQLRATDIVAEADCNKITEDNTVLIKYDVQNVGRVESVEGNRENVRLSVEAKRSKWIRVVQNVIGEVAENYIVTSSTAELDIIEVSGPQSVVDMISYASAEMDVTGYSNSITANVDVKLYDVEGNLVESDSVRKSENSIRMKVEVLALKEVPIEFNYMGNPAEGFMVTEVVSGESETVVIAGTPYVLSGISKISVPEDCVNVTGASSDVTETIDLRSCLPNGVILADQESSGLVRVTMRIEPVVERTLKVPVENIRVINLPEGLEIEMDEAVTELSVHVSGLAEQVNPIRATDVRGTVDFAGWMEEKNILELSPGRYDIPVVFESEDGIKTEEVKMKIKIVDSM